MLLLINVILTLWVSCANGQVKPCDFPDIKHGGLFHENMRRPHFPVAVGKYYSYYCDERFETPSGSYWDYIHCTQNGWSPAVPCLRTCSKSDIEIENGFISESSSIYILNKEIQYKCKPGYATADGNSSGSITCLQNGWSTQPICIKFCDMPVFENSRAKSNGVRFKLHDTLDYECYDGYEISYGNTTGSIVCGEDGWSHLPTCYNSSEKCGPPPPISNGGTTSFLLKLYVPQSRVEYQCQSYYELQGSNYVTCSNGEWSEPPRCILKPCDFPDIKHGGLFHENMRRPHFPVAVGKYYSYYCDERFETPSGSYWDYIHCTQNGWSPAVPCLRTCSKSDIEIENGFISESSSIYILNKEIQYKCKPGYATADGNSSGSITCLQNGWSTQPICIKFCDMPVFENSRAKSNGVRFKLHDTLDYECYDGYEISYGNTTGSIVCGEDGWSHLPTCYNSSEKCGPPPPISNGGTTSFLLKLYVPQSRVEYQCQSYYELQGSNYVTCSNGEWSEPPRCIHPCIITEKNMNKNNIKLKGRNDRKYYAKTGDTIEFMCKLGYNANTSILSFQAVCREGIVEYPRCE
ncbi:complement factor H-related protein 4 isoform X2 [Pan paniscus]|uniref:complement factor H-related protein 4 isoform X1 n=1 Tax=Pan paniscus TaxID=9597 RepID=UPI0030051B61